MFPRLKIVVEPKAFWISPVRMTWVSTVLVMVIDVGAGPTKFVVGCHPVELDELTVRFAMG